MEKPGKSHRQGSFRSPSRCKEEKLVCRELRRTSWASQGDPDLVGAPSAPEHPFCKTRVLGKDAYAHAFIEQKLNYVSGSEGGPGDRR